MTERFMVMTALGFAWCLWLVIASFLIAEVFSAAVEAWEELVSR